MLFVHEVHAVIGEHELQFEDAVRDEYLGALGDRDDMRLLWYLNSTHGAGEAYKVVTLTAVRDGDAWERLEERRRTGDLRDWATRVDAMRYGSIGTLLVAEPWSPMGEPDLGAVPTTVGDAALVVLREDALTGVDPDAAAPPLGADPDAVLTCLAAFAPAFGPAGERRVVYRVGDVERWTAAWDRDEGWADWPGSLTGSVGAVVGSSRLLRTVTWLPLP